MHRAAPALASLLLTVAGLVGCTSDQAQGESSCVGGKCDSLDDLEKPDSEIEESECDGVLLDMSGRPQNQRVAGRLSDPFAKFALREGACPTDFRSIVEKLNDLQEDCTVGTHVISEDASTLQMALNEDEAIAGSSYRTVTTRQCDNKNRAEIMFSQFGITAESGAPSEVEIIAFDESAGVFNYYKIHNDGDDDSVGTFGFFGNSADFLLRGSGEPIELEDGAETSERDCARCHNGGGLVMKEIESPWVHWRQSSLAGADQIVADNEDLYGELRKAPNLENTVKLANREWNAQRIALVREKSNLKELLRPLFCPVEIQIESPGTAADYNLVNATLGSVVASDFQFDVQGTYDALKEELGQTMFSPIEADDTLQGSTQLMRSAVDKDYVRLLVEERLISDEFRRSVLMVDFTRPVFSDDRCKLLEFTPDDISLSNKSGLENKIRDGFIDALEGESSAARELRRNLIATKTEDARSFFRTRVEIFAEACEERIQIDDSDDVDGDGTELLRDIMTYLSLQRSLARERDIIEFAGTLAFDQFESGPGEGSSLSKKLRLSPKSCKLVSRFTATADPVDGE